ncbi:MAG: hypothetical protein APR54_05180 [Candidatus Cloacimonas sp. SDB]|nr:MAG: hypothetical protein APR54_05180 [Candidatus Cloacimonas sp. SDB]
MNFIKSLFLGLIFTIFIFSIISAIEVGGHLTEDTIWMPENNPYNVVDNIYVDAGVTLTILPGTEVFVQSAPFTSWDDFDQNFWFQNGNTEAKMIWVDGRIIAEGSEQDSILITHSQNNNEYLWGTIYITENAEKCIFKNCRIEYSCGTGIYVGLIAWGAIFFMNKDIEIDECAFINNIHGLKGLNVDWYENVSIINSFFSANDNMSEFASSLNKQHLSINSTLFGYPKLLIAGNVFQNDYSIMYTESYFINNIIQNNSSTAIYIVSSGNTSYFYNNDFLNCDRGIKNIEIEMDSIYIRNNRFIGGEEAVDIDNSYVVISDNILEGCRILLNHSYSSIILNNTITNSLGTAISGNINVIANNIINNCNKSLSGGSTLFSSNLIINNNFAFSFLTENYIIENEVVIRNNEIIPSPYIIYGNPIFRNCILDFELPEECIDGGGNIWVDSVQVQQIFEDIENGDFHLLENSIAIDAGFDTLDYYYPFDMDYNHRIWDGDNDGSAVIDIGPYEFGSPQLGGIEGFTYNPTTGDPVKYVLLKINNVSGEFTFSDSIGNFDYKLPAGLYDVYCERIYYDDVVEYQVEVIDGEFTQIQIPMFESVNAYNNDIPPEITGIQLSNYPNPFNPTTTISFSLPEGSKVEVFIYNIKGQLVKNISKGTYDKGIHKIKWDGTDYQGKSLGSGLYICALVTDRVTTQCKMLFLK